MKIKNLYPLQATLDNLIEKNAHVEGVNLLPQKSLALLVELAELANETRCFKYWSKKGPSDKKVTIEEYSDGLHFLISIGIIIDQDKNYDFFQNTYTLSGKLVNNFNDLFKNIGENYLNWNKENHLQAMKLFLNIGKELKFTEEEICEAYILKNKINHERQDSNY